MCGQTNTSNHPIWLWVVFTWHKPLRHHKFNMWQINNENCVKFIDSLVHTLYIWLSCVDNMFDTRINVLTNGVRTYEWTNVTQIFHFPKNFASNVFSMHKMNVWNVKLQINKFAQFLVVTMDMTTWLKVFMHETTWLKILFMYSWTPYNYLVIYNLKHWKLVNWKGKELKGRHMYLLSIL
jgi:hypothetical protein